MKGLKAHAVTTQDVVARADRALATANALLGRQEPAARETDDAEIDGSQVEAARALSDAQGVPLGAALDFIMSAAQSKPKEASNAAVFAETDGERPLRRSVVVQWSIRSESSTLSGMQPTGA